MKLGNIIGMAMAVTYMLFPEQEWLLPVAIISTALGFEVSIVKEER